MHCFRLLAAALLALSLSTLPALGEPVDEPASVRLPMPQALEHPVEIEAVELPLKEVVRRLKDQVGLNALFDEDVRLSRPVSIKATGSLREVLDALTEQEGLACKAYNPWTLLFFPDSPEKRWAYSDENPMNGPGPQLPEALGSPRLSFDSQGASVLSLFVAVDEASPLRFRFDTSMRLDEKTDFVTSEVSVEEALELLCLKLGLTWQLGHEDLVLVYPATFEKMKQHRDRRLEGVSEKGPPPGWSGR